MSNKKKIVVFTDWYEPGYKAGGPVRSCVNFAAAMGAEFDIFIVTGDRDLGDTAPYPNIATDTWTEKSTRQNPPAESGSPAVQDPQPQFSVESDFPTVGDPRVHIWYATPGHLTASVIRQLLSEIKPDYVYLNSMYSWNYTILPLLVNRRRLWGRWIIAPRGMLQAGAMQYRSAKKKLFLTLLKITGIPKRLTFQATDRQEAEDIRRYFPAGNTVVLPNFPQANGVTWKPLRKTPGDLRCIFLSRVAPKKNLLFLLNVLHDWPAEQRLELTIRGEVEDQEYWEKCRAVIRALPSSVTVQAEGPLPNAQVTGVLQQHHLFVLPTFGENFGHAIFEALLAGKPVLISDKTPWSALEARMAGHDLPLDPVLFGEKLRFYAAMDQSRYDQWSKAAAAYAATIQNSEGLKGEYKKLLFS